MAEIDELEIYNKLTSGASVKGLAKIYGCSRTKIQKIKDNGKYYIDMATGELIFTAKTVTIIEQAFHNLETNLILYDNLGDRKSGLLRDRAVVPRLASFLMSYFNMEITEKSKDSFISKLRDWKAKKIKLVGCDTLGNINQQINDIALDFINNEENRASDSYYIDKNGLPRGYGLWYVKITDNWLNNLKPYIYVALSNKSILKEQNLRNYFFSRLKKEKEKTKDENLKKDISEALKFNYINSKVSFLLVTKYGNDIYNCIKDNRILYVETKAYYNGLVPPEMEKILLEYIYSD